ncbi:unnamed protein product [Caretta caretta]
MSTAPLSSLSSCLFYEDFDWVLGTVQSTEPQAVHNSLVIQSGDHLTPKFSIGPEESQQVLDQVLMQRVD